MLNVVAERIATRSSFNIQHSTFNAPTKASSGGVTAPHQLNSVHAEARCQRTSASVRSPNKRPPPHSAAWFRPRSKSAAVVHTLEDEPSLPRVRGAVAAIQIDDITVAVAIANRRLELLKELIHKNDHGKRATKKLVPFLQAHTGDQQVPYAPVLPTKVRWDAAGDFSIRSAIF